MTPYSDRRISGQLFPERDEQHKEKCYKKNRDYGVGDGPESEFRLHRVWPFPPTSMIIILAHFQWAKIRFGPSLFPAP